jgi:CRISPR/Cas system-associated exonuclease Cas4 (RecB family)
MRLTYHSWRDYKDCPKKYYLKHVKKQISPVDRNDYFPLYGKLVEKFFQHFSNMWRFTMPYMPPEEIQFKLNKIYEDILKISEIDWNAKFVTENKESLFDKACKDVCAIMDSHNQNYFLNTKAEFTIEVSTKLGVDIVGRLDFIHYDAVSNAPLIFDGKGTNTIGKNVSKEQLFFYALLYLLHFNQIPEYIGFFYYRFNTYVPIDFNLNILNEFRAKLSLDIKQILEDTEFKATPKPKSCKYCDYQTICKDCIDDRNKRKRPIKVDLPDVEGVIEIGI